MINVCIFQGGQTLYKRVFFDNKQTIQDEDNIDDDDECSGGSSEDFEAFCHDTEVEKTALGQRNKCKQRKHHQNITNEDQIKNVQ